MKKRGFGESRWNGFGGKVKEDEEIKDAAIREIYEETSNNENGSGVVVEKKELEKVATLDFIFPHEPNWDQRVHVFKVYNWEGILNESEEMKPKWFNINNVPYDDMWADDIHWLPRVLKGEKVNAEFSFDEKDNIIESKIEIS